jgi:hypothetical protein
MCSILNSKKILDNILENFCAWASVLEMQVSNMQMGHRSGDLPLRTAPHQFR